MDASYCKSAERGHESRRSNPPHITPFPLKSMNVVDKCGEHEKKAETSARTGPDGAPAEVRILGGGVYEIEGPTAETVAIIRERRGLY